MKCTQRVRKFCLPGSPEYCFLCLSVQAPLKPEGVRKVAESRNTLHRTKDRESCLH